MQTINLDISTKSIIPLLYAKQGDVGRKFKAILTNGGVPYSVPAGSAISIWYSGASGEGNYTDIGADSAVSFSGNEITVELITQMLAKSCEGNLSIVINTADGDQLGTWNIPYMVEALPGMGSSTAQDYFTAFSQAVQNLPYPDTTLSAAGKAADAKATGEALAKKAPAGYGLGEEPVYLENADTAKTNGWYWFDENTVNKPLYLDYGTIFVKRRNYLEIVQEVADMYGIRAQRRYNNGTHGEWEYENPPMKPGVEYRTTERHNGKPVYKKLIRYNHGSTISAELETVDVPIQHYCTDMDERWVVRASAGDYTLPYTSLTESTRFIFTSNSIHLRVNNAGWGSNYTFNFVLAYTKTTD